MPPRWHGACNFERVLLADQRSELVRRCAQVLGIAGLTIILSLPWVAQHFAEQNAIHELPPELRSRLFEHSLEDFRSLCTGRKRSSALEAQCAEKARVLRLYPECSETCVLALAEGATGLGR